MRNINRYFDFVLWAFHILLRQCVTFACKTFLLQFTIPPGRWIYRITYVFQLFLIHYSGPVIQILSAFSIRTQTHANSNWVQGCDNHKIFAFEHRTVMAVISSFLVCMRAIRFVLPLWISDRIAFSNKIRDKRSDLGCVGSQMAHMSGTRAERLKLVTA